MPAMSAVETAFCRSGVWNRFARGTVTPTALRGQALEGDVLELGSGGGAMAENMLRTFPAVRLTASDLDERMLTAARQRLRSWPNAQVELADSTALPFDDGSFDAVVSFLMLHHVVEWSQALAEVGRVLRPGGLLIGYDLTNTRLARLIHQADRSPHRLVSPDELTSSLVSHGFQESHILPSLANHVMRFSARKPSPSGRP